MKDPFNKDMVDKGYTPLFSGSPQSKVIIIGQAPGVKAQTSGIPWDDKSGENLRQWLGLSEEQFYDEKITALIPMDFFYPGKGKTGDLPPRKGFAEKWHEPLLSSMQTEPLILLVGQYSQKFYLGGATKKNLTETVRAYKEYLDLGYLPLPHPSPRNNIWMKKNEWFKRDLIPLVQKIVAKKLKV